MSYKIVLERSCTQRTNNQKIEESVKKLIERSLSGNRGRNWSYSIVSSRGPLACPDAEVRTCRNAADLRPELSADSMWKWSKTIKFERSRGFASTKDSQWAKIVSAIDEKSRSSVYGKFPWKIKSASDLLGITTKKNKESKKSNQPKDYGQIELEKNGFFDHIYERKHHVNIVYSALEAFKDSNMRNRFHCVLHGPPGCGKSDILISVSKMLGPENEAFIKFDATSMTEAGVSKLLLESDFIPPVLIVEEIEKAPENHLRWLLGILDHRAEIRRTNFRIGNKARNVKMLCLATVNDLNLFKNSMSGALASRFAHEIYCPRPSRAVMEKILLREVERINGDTNWIEPTLSYCIDDKGLDDPRKVIPICLCGREKLLTGEYQKSLNAVLPPKS